MSKRKKYVVRWDLVEHPHYLVTAESEGEATYKAYKMLKKDAESIVLDSVENETIFDYEEVKFEDWLRY